MWRSHSTAWRRGGGRGGRLAVASLVLIGSALLAACGSGDSARDDALAALDRATDAAGLEAEMAALVGDLPDAPTEEETSQAEQAVTEIDDSANEVLASADTGEGYDEEISKSVENIRSAGRDVSAGLKQPDSLRKAKGTAVGRLKGSNQSLTTATEQIGAELEDDEGNLSAQDADALEATFTEIETSGEAIAGAEETLTAQECPEGTLVQDENVCSSNSFACALTPEASSRTGFPDCSEISSAEAAPVEEAAPPNQSTPSGCPPGTFPVTNADGSVTCSDES